MSIFAYLDLLPVSRIAKIKGTTYTLEFNVRTLARAEQIYLSAFNRDINSTIIIGELYNGKTSALMALVYAALLEGGTVVTWDDFGRDMFGSKEFDPLFDVAVTAIANMLGGNDSDDAPEGEPKN